MDSCKARLKRENSMVNHQKFFFYTTNLSLQENKNTTFPYESRKKNLTPSPSSPLIEQKNKREEKKESSLFSFVSLAQKNKDFVFFLILKKKESQVFCPLFDSRKWPNKS